MNPNAQRKKPANTTRVDLKRLEQELHAAQPRNRQQHRADNRGAAVAEAVSIARPAGARVVGRPQMGGHA